MRRLTQIVLPLCLVAALFLLSQPMGAGASPLAQEATATPEAESESESEDGDRAPQWYVVQAGDTLGAIAARFGMPMAELQSANSIDDPGSIRVGQILAIPGSDGRIPNPDSRPGTNAVNSSRPRPARGSVFERLSPAAQRATPSSPFYRTTWVSYYGRPGVDLMGILGEYPLEELLPLLEEQAAAYDEANGPELSVTPALELVYGMALKGEGDDGSYLGFMSDAQTREYIETAAERGYPVILDIQVGALTPVEAMSRGFRWLEYPNVHLALDPEFAMVHPDQTTPGRPPGFVTAAQVNEVQRAMVEYMRENGIEGRKVLVVHQFLHDMLVDKQDLEWHYPIDLTIVADGFGYPWPKIAKYNAFMSPIAKFTGFKLFYRWDEPVMTEREVMGVDMHPNITFMEVSPNLVIYQ